MCICFRIILEGVPIEFHKKLLYVVAGIQCQRLDQAYIHTVKLLENVHLKNLFFDF